MGYGKAEVIIQHETSLLGVRRRSPRAGCIWKCRTRPSRARCRGPTASGDYIYLGGVEPGCVAIGGGSEGRAMRTRTLSGLQCHHSAQRDRTAVHLCVEASGRKAERRRGQEEEAGHRGCGRLAVRQRDPAETARAAAPSAGGTPADDALSSTRKSRISSSRRWEDGLAAGAAARRHGARRTAGRLVGAAERARRR